MRSNFSSEKYDGNEVKCSKRFPSELYKLLLIVEIKLQALLSTAEESLRKKLDTDSKLQNSEPFSKWTLFELKVLTNMIDFVVAHFLNKPVSEVSD